MKYKKTITIGFVVICLMFFALMMKAYFDGKFNSVETLQEYIKGYGLFAPVALICVQAMQVVIPILPGFLGCAVGAVMFGSLGGFICNYVGISLGSIIAFILARKLGVGLVQSVFPKGKYDKYSEWAAKSKSYAWLLFWGMVLPLFPDDFFCYFSGLTKMKLKKFALIIIIGKPWCILAYSLLFAQI